MERIEILIQHYLDNSLSTLEKKELDEWINQSPANRSLFEKITNHEYLSNELQQLYAISEEKGWNKVMAHMQAEKPVKRMNWRLWLAAACVVLAIGGSYLYTHPKQTPSPTTTTAKTDVAAPQSSRAMIQLPNGQTIPLDSINKGVIVQQGGMQVIKNEKGEIVYSGEAREEIYNTIINPRGSRVISLTLHDGTKVWLNSETSLRYPIAFTKNTRQVQVNGEAYFEVAKDATKKFVVEANGLTTEVLGTHFNINTYEQSTVTLLEGSVKVSQEGSTNILKPGQQAEFLNHQLHVKNIDPDKVMAWHAGIFYFEDDKLPVIMQELSRWYDLHVKFTGKIPEETFGGIINRDESLFNVLKALNTSGVKFKLENKTITIGE